MNRIIFEHGELGAVNTAHRFRISVATGYLKQGNAVVGDNLLEIELGGRHEIEGDDALGGILPGFAVFRLKYLKAGFRDEVRRKGRRVGFKIAPFNEK